MPKVQNMVTSLTETQQKSINSYNGRLSGPIIGLIRRKE